MDDRSALHWNWVGQDWNSMSYGVDRSVIVPNDWKHVWDQDRREAISLNFVCSMLLLPLPSIAAEKLHDVARDDDQERVEKSRASFSCLMKSRVNYYSSMRQPLLMPPRPDNSVRRLDRVSRTSSPSMRVNRDASLS